jgi:hypothetical protein
MTRWENEHLWDARGNYLGNGERAMPPAARPHQRSCTCDCGVFICPKCGRAMPWCWGAADGPECDECWPQAQVSAHVQALREERLRVLATIAVAVLGAALTVYGAWE